MKTTVNQHETIYVLYFSYNYKPGTEYAQVYLNWEDADKERKRFLAEIDIDRAYIVSQTLW